MFGNITYPVTYHGLGFGEETISWSTLMRMKDIIKESSKNPLVISMARSIIRYVPEKDYQAEAEKIYNWTRSHTKYVRDPYGTETITTPPAALDIIRRGGLFEGDCDCLTVLTLSLLRAVGFPVKIVAAGYKNKPLSHVYGKVLIRDKWIPIEPIKKGVELGWEAPGKTSTQEVTV